MIINDPNDATDIATRSIETREIFIILNEDDEDATGVVVAGGHESDLCLCECCEPWIRQDSRQLSKQSRSEAGPGPEMY